MKNTKKLFKEQISGLLSLQGTDEVLSEAALPAYAHKNPLIDFIFWKRVEIAAGFIETKAKGKANILDFGCGTGVLSYKMAQSGHQVLALDLDLTPVNLLRDGIKYPDNITFKEGDFLNMDFSGQSFDFIVALDVLEHIPLDVLPVYLKKFNSILNPEGSIIISGPTENILYKIGRKLAGSDFTGEYHETTIGRIKHVFNDFFAVTTLRKLIWPLTLFEVFHAEKRKP
ncbi:MAG TPA: class I SAM-dependent methyltransferase [Flavobacterium sp.]|jgi:2-polyprenyl-3-methyl-5-hydroxy-6-metoxy-1,4-benzoquinol methylase